MARQGECFHHDNGGLQKRNSYRMRQLSISSLFTRKLLNTELVNDHCLISSLLQCVMEYTAEVRAGCFVASHGDKQQARKDKVRMDNTWPSQMFYEPVSGAWAVFFWLLWL